MSVLPCTLISIKAVKRESHLHSSFHPLEKTNSNLQPMPSVPYQRRDEKPRNKEVDDNSVKFVGSSHASPSGQPNVAQSSTPLAKAPYDKYANGAIVTRTGTGDTIPRSVQQSWVPPSNSQYTSGGGNPAQGPSVNQTPGPSSRPEVNQRNSGAQVHSNSGPRQSITGCYNPEVNNSNSFNDNYYDRQIVNNDNRKGASKGRRSKKRQQESSSDKPSNSD